MVKTASTDSIERLFRRTATREDREALSKHRGTDTKTAYRQTWYDKRMQATNPKATKNAQEAETKKDIKAGWYMNEDQLIKDQGGQINLERATRRANNIMSYCKKKGPPYITSLHKTWST